MSVDMTNLNLTPTSPDTIYLDGLEAGDVEYLAIGRYQRALLYGQQRWSGADLRGDARTWGASYERSRNSLIKRLIDAGYYVGWEELPRHPNGGGGRVVMVVGRAGRSHDGRGE